MPLAIARKNLREDPQTAAIAKELGVDVEEYIEQVLEYAQNPDKEPELELLDDEAAQDLGPEAATMDEVVSWLEAVESGEITLEDRVQVAEADGFSKDAERSEVLRQQAGAEMSRRAPGVEEMTAPKKGDATPEAGSVLKAQLMEQQRSMRLGVDAQRAGAGRPKPAPGTKK